MNLRFLLLSFCAACSSAAADHARNVILFIGDAGGVSTLCAASILAHDKPHGLFIQHMPCMALMETSTSDEWLTDSAAAMTAIITGHKTLNGVLSESNGAVRGHKHGEPLQTLLEHAEARGLSTGVVTNVTIFDATPAACYAHANERNDPGLIFAQVLAPHFGDGVDIIIGKGRAKVLQSTALLGIDIVPALRARGYDVVETPSELPQEPVRSVALYDGPDYDPLPVLERIVKGLSKNTKGYFLMLEWDMHTDNPKRGLDRAIVMDALVKRATEIAGPDTLIIFTADHSFDLRIRGGRKGEPLLANLDEKGAPAPGTKPALRIDPSHTGEDVLVAAQGPGAERVRGCIANTDLFDIMMSAYGWNE
ncbi:MAG: alkaline phosphatase [Opitutaceae bacterium]